MIEEFTRTTKQVADELINISELLADKMQSWSDVFAEHPDSPNKDVSTGFLNKFDEEDGINLIVDIRAPAEEKQAIIRIWALESLLDEDGTKVFNNIQLNFRINYETARQSVDNNSAMTRSDIRTLLHQPTTELAEIVISNRSGLMESAEEQRGKRYDLTALELSERAEQIGQIQSALMTTLAALKTSAKLETSK